MLNKHFVLEQKPSLKNNFDQHYNIDGAIFASSVAIVGKWFIEFRCSSEFVYFGRLMGVNTYEPIEKIWGFLI